MTIKLTIRNFSCIDDAELEAAAITVIIGPQASGKSVLSKLMYFCSNVVYNITNSVYDIKSFSEFKADQIQRFKDWLPVTAWGRHNFRIKQDIGNLQIEFNRVRSKNGLSDNVNFKISGFVEELYNEFQNRMLGTIDQNDEDLGASVRKAMETRALTSQDLSKRLWTAIGLNTTHWQMFIPAGRSYFTTQARTAATFENANALDPVTLEFGRMFNFVRDNSIRRSSHLSGGPENRGIRSNVLRDIIGGDVQFTKDSSTFATIDGRILTFPYLSSGQQELLPLLMTLDTFGLGVGSLTYIEEPEAHLFPKSQSILLKHLVGMLVKNTKVPQLLMTTHSPYILARCNNLIKASQVASISQKNRRLVEDVIPHQSWINKGEILAYAIKDGSVVSIIAEDGSIAAGYLDEVSDDIMKEYNDLLQVQYGNA